MPDGNLNPLWARFLRQKKDLQARDDLAKTYFFLVEAETRRMLARLPLRAYWEKREDLGSAGVIGLLQALDHFTPPKDKRHDPGRAFEAYARYRIRGQMVDELRNLDFARRNLRKQARAIQEAERKLEARFGRSPREEETAKALGMFITSGMRADFLTVAVRTGGPGAGGVSLLLIEGDTPGLQRTSLKKMGWWASDTATLYFENCRVPAANLIGEENSGFRTIMLNFNDERLHMAASSTAFARVCLDEAITWAKERKTFGKPLTQHQVIRHKLVDMAMRIEASQAMLEMLTWRLEQGDDPIAEICMLKNQATTTLAFCASEAVQIFGGAGFMRGAKVERIYREVKVNAIGGGAEEIMKDLASRQMGL